MGVFFYTSGLCPSIYPSQPQIPNLGPVVLQLYSGNFARGVLATKARDPRRETRLPYIGHPYISSRSHSACGTRHRDQRPQIVLHGMSFRGGLAIVSGGFNDSKVGPGEKNLKMNLLRAGIGHTMKIRLSQCIRRHFHILLRIINILLVNLDQTTVSCQILQSLLLGWLHS
jgi:hypothetical protein